MFLFRKSAEMPTRETALKGRETPIPTAERHFVNGRPLQGPYPEGMEKAVFGLGCFWGAERKFWQLGDGVFVTAVGYAGGATPNPTYEEVCSGRTGHNEVVLVVFDPKRISYEELLRPSGRATTRRRGCARATTSAPSTAPASTSSTRRSVAPRRPRRRPMAGRLPAAAMAPITTEIADAGPFYFAEDYHQQYLAKNPMGYCGLGGTGVACQIGTSVAA